MEKGIDQLTGELAKLAKELSKAIPKGYAELVREYSTAHQLAAGKNLFWAVILLLVITASIVIIIKIANKVLNDDELDIDGKAFGLGILGFVSIIALLLLIGTLGAQLDGFIYELQRALAPNYYMLHQLIK